MSRILVVEPVVMEPDETADAYLRSLTAADTELRFVALETGPASIETFSDAAVAAPEVLRLLEREAGGCDAVVIDCFADPALKPARERLGIPIVGAAEASMALALELGHSFAVVAIGDNSKPWTELQAREMGIERRLAAAKGVDIPVLDLERDLQATTAALLALARECVDERGADVIILGCTGMFVVADRLREQLDVPVIEPMAAAVKTAEMLARLGLTHSHRGLYRRLTGNESLR